MDQQTMELIKSALTVLQLVVTFGSLCIMLYTFKKFLAKPQDTLAARVAALETKVTELDAKLNEYIEDIERSLQLSNEDSKLVKEGCMALQSTVYSLIEFELSYCRRTGYDGDVSDLEDAAKELHNYLKNK